MTIPKLTEFPEWIEANKRYNKAYQDLDLLERKQGELNAALAAADAPDATAEAILAARDAHRALADFEYDLRAARTAWNAGRNAISLARRKFGEMAQEKLGPKYLEAVERVARAVLEAGRANAELFELRDFIEAGEISLSMFRAMPFNGAGLLKDPNSRASKFLDEVREFFAIEVREAADMPVHSAPGTGGYPHIR